ncbi:LapB repeat-containing protein [Listeria costaricensis]|uniref:LapB repeat-containing protein n=1 Tax=Listeria costaricensis TaxID=2026604 RepID=UPI0013C3F887|nr:LapB repeat-containing protein [Listeria costaricensis]
MKQASEQLLGDSVDGQSCQTIFPDAALAKCVASELKKSVTEPVTQAELNTIQRLNATVLNIQSIEGMEYLTNLDYLNLEYNQIVDISPLSDLKNLTYLRLSENKVVDVSPLEPLAKYHPNMELYIDNNHIFDVSYLGEFTNIIDAGKQVITEDQVIDAPDGKIKIPYNIRGLDGHSMQPRSIYPTGSSLEIAMVKSTIAYLVWPEDMLLKSGHGKIEVYAQFGEANGPGFGGTYQLEESFNPPSLTYDDAITYSQGANVTNEAFLADIHAVTDSGCELATDLNEVVDWQTPGDYKVAIEAVNTTTLNATARNVTVHVEESAVSLACLSEISYQQGTVKTEADFLVDIDAQTDPGAEIDSDFETAADLTTSGDYEVTVTAKSSAGQTSKKVTVHVTPLPLELVQVPDDITFKNTAVASGVQTIFRSSESGNDFVVKDTRAEQADWQLSLSIAAPLTAESGDQLTDALIYRDKSGQDTVLQPGVAYPCLTSATATRQGDTFTYSWGENEGLLLKLNTSAARAATYTTTINWTLQNVPSS